MRARIILMPDGGLTIITDEGSYEQGVANMNGLLAALGAAGVRFATIDPHEQHRHDDLHVHQHVHTEAGHEH